MTTPSTITDKPGGFVAIVTAVGAFPYSRSMPSISVALYPLRFDNGIPAGIYSMAGPPFRENANAGYSMIDA